MMTSKFIDYDKLLEAVHKVHIAFGEQNIDVNDVKVLLSDWTIRRLNFMRQRTQTEYYMPPHISDGKMHIFAIHFPSEANYPYNDKIIFYTKDSCYRDGLTVEVLLKDIEVDSSN